MERNVKSEEVGNFREREDGLIRGEKTSEGSGQAAGEAPVISKAPPPKAPSAYWQYLKVEDAAKTRKGQDSNGIDSKGKEQR